MKEIETHLHQAIVELLSKPRGDFELEIRLGRAGSNRFSTNIGRDRFERLLQKLDVAYPELISISEFAEQRLKSNVRIRTNKKGKVIERIKKTRYKVNDFKLDDNWFDFRVGISRERPIPSDIKPKGVKIYKQRHQLSFDLYVIELTRVSFASRGNQRSRYQIELEVDLSKIEDSSISRLVSEILVSLKMLLE